MNGVEETRKDGVKKRTATRIRHAVTNTPAISN
jgi:hypothetical protein